MQPLDWNLLKSFLITAEEGSLSAAARRLAISQPTVGRHISELEELLDVRLFERTRSGLSPTSTGLALIEDAQSMRAHADAVSRIATGRSESVAGTVRITTSEMLAVFVLPAMLAELRQLEPDIQIELVASDSTDNLLQREADIAVRMYRPTQVDVITRKVADFQLGAFAHRDYLARKGTPTNIDDLTGHDIIGFDQSPGLIDGMRQLGLEVDRGFFPLRADNQIVGWQTILAGLGIGFTQVWLAQTRNELIQVFEDVDLPVLPAWLTVHRDIRTSPRIRLVYDFLAEKLSHGPWSGGNG